MLRKIFYLVFFISVVSISNVVFAGTHNYYIPNNFTVSGGGTFCVSAGTTILSSSMTYNATPCSSTSGSGNSNNYATLSYQWYSDTDVTPGGGTVIAGATGTSYSAPINVVGTYYYYCILTWTDPDVAGACTGGTLTAGNLTVIVNGIPTISNAGSDFTTGSCVTTATLAGNTPTIGTGTWTIISGPGSLTTPGSPTSGVTGLQAGVATTFRWTISNSPCTSSTDDVVITGGACASPDLCTGATPVTCNNSYSGTTTGMTADAGMPACGTTPGTGGSVWYVLAGTGGSVTASLCGSAYDTKINVYSGASCAALTTCVASNDDFCGLQSQVTFGTVVGTNYYIMVNGFGTATGNYTLNISCCAGTVPNCATSPSPANSTTGVNSCGVLSWTAATCNSPTSYDVYFGTTNPPPYVTNVTGTSYTPPLSGSTTYYWEIRPRNASGPAASCSVWSFTTAANPNPQYVLVDDATSAAPYSCVTLTPNIPGQRGCAWDQNSTLAFASNFTYDWTINLGNNDGGADGMAFVIQNDPLGRCKCGVSGNQLGAGGIANSLIVELDTYINWEDRDDGMPNMNTDCISPGGPESDHLDIWINGVVNPSTDGSNCTTAPAERVIPAAVPLQNGGADYNIENGLDHKLRISWNAGTSTLTASVMNNATTVTYGTVSYSFSPITVFGTNSPYFGFTGSTGGLTNQQTFCNPPALLPVEMSAFNTQCDNGHINMTWSTNSEHNNDYFKVERSRDGQIFDLMAIVDGVGNTTLTIEYSWTDSDPANELVYYKLTQVDFDGNEKVLNEISTNCSELSGIQINSLVQTEGQMKLNLTNELKGNYTIELLECSGKVIANTSRVLESGTNEIYFTDVQVSKGIYLVRVGNSATSAVRKVGIF